MRQGRADYNKLVGNFKMISTGSVVHIILGSIFHVLFSSLLIPLRIFY